VVAVFDLNGHSVAMADCRDALFFCALCKTYYHDRGKVWEGDEHPCTHKHLGYINKAQEAGGSYIYTCDLGFVFWTSPFYTGGHVAGALSAGMILGMDRNGTIERIYALSGGAISRDEAQGYLANIPERTHEEIRARAEMLLLCAGKVSKSAEEPGATRRARAKQEPGPPQRRIHSGGISETAKSGYSLDKERVLLAALRRGDTDMGRTILNEILDTLLGSHPDDFSFIHLRAIELVVLLSRATVMPDMIGSNAGTDTVAADAATLETNDRCLQRIQDSKNSGELHSVLNIIIDRIARQLFSFHGVRHASALRKAERFIWEHYSRKVSLREIAHAAGLSAPYFSTIFKDEMGEHLSSYLNRLRVEKAVTMLTESDSSLKEIAESCGFEDQSWFSKIFKSHTGVSPGRYRKQGSGIYE
jgi:AraC-like DNA-binding protein/ligand-binding sensor protein